MFQSDAHRQFGESVVPNAPFDPQFGMTVSPLLSTPEGKRYCRRTSEPGKLLPSLHRTSSRFCAEETRSHLKSVKAAIANNKRKQTISKRERKHSFHDDVVGVSTGPSQVPLTPPHIYHGNNKHLRHSNVAMQHTTCTTGKHFPGALTANFMFTPESIGSSPVSSGKKRTTGKAERTLSPSSSMFNSKQTDRQTDCSSPTGALLSMRDVLDAYWKIAAGNQDGRIDFATYSNLNRLILECLLGGMNPEASRKTIEAVWKRENRGEPSMNRETFDQCLLKIAGAYMGATVEAKSDPHAKMLQRVFENITIMDPSGYYDLVTVENVVCYTPADEAIQQKTNLFEYLIKPPSRPLTVTERRDSSRSRSRSSNRMLDSRDGGRVNTPGSSRSHRSASTPMYIPLSGSNKPEFQQGMPQHIHDELEQQHQRKIEQPTLAEGNALSPWTPTFTTPLFYESAGEGGGRDDWWAPNTTFNTRANIPDEALKVMGYSRGTTGSFGISKAGESAPSTAVESAPSTSGGYTSGQLYSDHTKANEMNQEEKKRHHREECSHQEERFCDEPELPTYENDQFLNKHWEAVQERPLPPSNTIAFVSRSIPRRHFYPEVPLKTATPELKKAQDLLGMKQKSDRHPVFLNHIEESKRLCNRVDELVTKCSNTPEVPHVFKSTTSIYHQLLLYMANSACCPGHGKLLLDTARHYNSVFGETYIAVNKEIESLRDSLQKATRKSVEQSQRVKRFVHKAGNATGYEIMKKSFRGWVDVALYKKKHQGTLEAVLGSYTKKSLLGRYFKQWHGNVLAWAKVRSAIGNAARISDESFFARCEVERLSEEMEKLLREKNVQDKRTAQREETYVKKIETLRNEMDEVSEALRAVEQKTFAQRLGEQDRRGSVMQRLIRIEDELLEGSAKETARKVHAGSQTMQLEQASVNDTSQPSHIPEVSIRDFSNEELLAEVTCRNLAVSHPSTTLSTTANLTIKTVDIDPSTLKLPPEQSEVKEEKPIARANEGHGMEDYWNSTSEDSEDMLDFFNFFIQNSHSHDFLEHDIRYLWKYMDIVPFSKGDEIIKQNETATWVGLIVRGSLNILVNDHAVAEMQAGELVGELGWFEKQKRTADCNGSEAGVIAALTYERIEQLTHDNNLVGQKFCNFLAGNAIEKLRNRITFLSMPKSRPNSRPSLVQEDVSGDGADSKKTKKRKPRKHEVRADGNNSHSEAEELTENVHTRHPTEKHSSRSSKLGWHHVKRHIEKSRIKKNRWLSSNSEVFYRVKVERSKKEAKDAAEKLEEATHTIDKVKQDKQREKILRKGLERTVDAMEQHILRLEQQLATQQQMDKMEHEPLKTSLSTEKQLDEGKRALQKFRIDSFHEMPQNMA